MQSSDFLQFFKQNVSSLITRGKALKCKHNFNQPLYENAHDDRIKAEPKWKKKRVKNSEELALSPLKMVLSRSLLEKPKTTERVPGFKTAVLGETQKSTAAIN